MAQSTKHLLAKSLKALMGEKTLDKITVKEIVARCGVNRQTFYYHFRDIYDLLDWLFVEEGNEFSRRFPDYHNQNDVEAAIRKMCTYLVENRTMAINIYNSLGRDIFGRYLTRELAKLLHLSLTRQAVVVGASETNVRALVNFYKHGLVGILLDWVDEGLGGDIDEIVSLYRPVIEGAATLALRQMTQR